MTAKSSTKRPFSTKPHALEPRGRPAKGQPAFSGATPDDPLESRQILKARRAVWAELTQAAAEKTWHRSVLVRKVLDEWYEKRMAGKKRKQGKKAAE